MGKKKRQENFQIFIISRFLVMLIFVVMCEFLVLFAMSYAYQLGMSEFPKTNFILTLVLFAIPIVLTALWFSKIIAEEVEKNARQEEELREKYERARNLMLSDIAHDLRTPITTIGGYAKALNDGLVTSDEKRKEYLEAIENKSERMKDLITLLFDYVRLDSENYQLRLEKTDIAELLRENAAFLYADIEEKEMEFEIRIPEEPIFFEIDRLQFSRVITNLINNALKHNMPGTKIGLAIEEDKKSGILEIVVSDNGAMINPLVAEHIFEPFIMADSSRATKGGSGLGLSIAKKIVEMHGWTITLHQDFERQEKSFLIKIQK
ncbi:MAG: HAMP domain-containing histidine kinase [Agathobacter sp.]|nr:HAMP domain-containing histidine kinase [Agathobacter sp.]